MKIIFTYNIESEMRYLRNLSSRVEHFKIHNYKVKTPHDLSLESIVGMNDIALAQIIRDELDPILAKKLSDELLNTIRLKNNEILKYFKTLPGKMPLKFIVRWTKYGPGGSYHAPETAVLTMNTSLDPFNNFIHEATHCIIEDPIVKRFALTQSEKESLVEYMTISFFPNKGYSKFGPPSTELLRRVGIIHP